MSGHDDIENRLTRAMAFTPSAVAMQGLDERVAKMLAAPAAPQARSGMGRLLRPLALAAALALTAGAVVAAVSLIDQLAEEASPGWATAWERAEILGIQQTDAGLTLSLERAYVDVNQVVLGMVIDGLDPLLLGDGANQLSWRTELIGPNGWTPPAEASNNVARGVAGDQSAFIFTFGSPPVTAGMWQLSVTSIGYGEGNMTDGSWTFAFELPEPEGTVVTGEASDTVGDATLTLTELRISPSIVVARIRLDVAGTTFAGWSAGTGQDGEVIRHGEATYQIWEEGIFAATPQENEYLTMEGVEDGDGTWEIVIPKLGYYPTADEGIHLEGPWTLTVTVP
jgi:hypothetical protein